MSEDDESGSSDYDGHSFIDNASSSDASQNDAHPFVDDEAEESADGLNHDSDSDADDAEFHPFLRLPPELRRQIWEAYCPDILSKARFIDCDGLDSHRELGVPLRIQDRVHRQQMICAVHRESRAIGLKAFPDSTIINWWGDEDDVVLRFNKDRDVFGFKGPTFLHGVATGRGDVYQHIRLMAMHLPVSMARDLPHWEQYVAALSLLPHLEVIYDRIHSGEVSRRKLSKWIELLSNWDILEYEEVGYAGLVTTLTNIHCWAPPDDATPREQLNPQNAAELYFRKRAPDIERLRSEAAIDYVRFELLIDFNDGEAATFEQAQHISDIPESELSPSEASDDSYPSTEGYAPWDEWQVDGPDLPVYIDGGDPAGGWLDVYDPWGGAEGHFSSAESDEDEGSLGIEVEDEEGVSSDEEASAVPTEPFSDEEAAEPARASKRRVVADSDDDDDEDGEPVRKRARGVQVISSDSEQDDEEAKPISGLNGSRQMARDDGTESSVVSDDSDTGEDDEDDDDAAVPNISLAERLKQFRDENPIPPDGSDGSDGSESEEGSFIVGGQYGDEDEEDEDEEDEEEGGGGIFDTHADESDDNDEPSDEED